MAESSSEKKEKRTELRARREPTLGREANHTLVLALDLGQEADISVTARGLNLEEGGLGITLRALALIVLQDQDLNIGMQEKPGNLNLSQKLKNQHLTERV